MVPVEESISVSEQRLRPYVSPLAAWALSLGASVGWGSIAVTSSTFLSGAGPLGGVLGTVIGGAVMLLIGRNYFYMMQRCPDAGGAGRFDPAFIPDTAVFNQVMRIAFISPWAFVGFENISHSAEEFTFPRRRAFRVMTVTLVTATLLYAFATLLSVTAYPTEYANWLEYIRNLSNISGIRGLPAFYAARHYLGQTGVVLLMLSLLGLILTSLISSIIALSRLFFALGKDGILPGGLAKLTYKAIPARATALVVVLSLVIPFLGRTAVGWIVDVTNVGAILVYCFASAAAWKTAREEKDRVQTVLGMAGMLVMVLFCVFLLLPDLLYGVSMATEAYLIFILWSVLGIFYFRWVMTRDKDRRFGQTSLVWLVFLSLIAFMALVWIHKLHEEEAVRLIQAVHSYDLNKYGFTGLQVPDDPYIDWIMARMHRLNLITTAAVIALLVLSLFAMLWNSFFLRQSGEEKEKALGTARELAYTDPLTGVKSKRTYLEAEERMDRRIRQGGTNALRWRSSI